MLGHAQPRNRSEEEVAGYRKAIDWVFARKRRVAIEPRVIQHLHALAQGGTSGDAGKWKRRTTKSSRFCRAVIAAYGSSLPRPSRRRRRWRNSAGTTTPFVRETDTRADRGRNLRVRPALYSSLSRRQWPRVPIGREHARDKHQGRPRKLPRLKVRNAAACGVRNLLTGSPRLREIPWVKFRVKDGEKGPMVWEAKCVPFWIKDENGLSSRPHRLLIARNVYKPNEIKFFLSNASASVPVETLLLAAFSRWRIERIFEDSKDELGLDHFEVRKYGSIQRHLILSCVSHLFLAEFRLEQGGKKRRSDHRPLAYCHQGLGAALGSRRSMLTTKGRNHRRAIERNATAKRRRPTLPRKTNHPAITRHGNPAQEHAHLRVATMLAL